MNNKWIIEFFEFSDGFKPVFEFINNLPTKEKAKIISEIGLLQDYGIELSLPRVRKIHGKKYSGLWELRVRFSSNYYRILYFLYKNRTFILLHGFTKKNKKIERKHLKMAKTRMEDYKK